MDQVTLLAYFHYKYKEIHILYRFMMSLSLMDDTQTHNGLSCYEKTCNMSSYILFKVTLPTMNDIDKHNSPKT